MSENVIGQKIRKLRRDRDWTQQELGEKAGVNFRNLTHYESGRLKPGLKILSRLAEVFQVPLDSLVEAPLETATSFRDPELKRYLELLDGLNDEDRQTVKNVIQAMIVKNQVRQLGQIAG
ncbi:MAG: helix-turn-helix transcriptional regulator [Vulcanimicrobiota bacterium]